MAPCSLRVGSYYFGVISAAYFVALGLKPKIDPAIIGFSEYLYQKTEYGENSMSEGKGIKPVK